MALTAVIPFRAFDQSRIRALRRVIHHMRSHLPEVRLLVSECSPVPEFYRLGLDVPCVWEYQPGAFNPSRARNNGIKLAGTDILLLDGDILVDPEVVRIAPTVGDAIACYNRLVHIDCPPECVDFRGCASFTTGYFRSEATRNMGMYCATFVRSSVFGRAGYFDEAFVDWGWEDAEYQNRMIRLGAAPGLIPGDVFHIDHDPSPTFVNNAGKNLQLFQQLNSLSVQELQERHGLATPARGSL